MYSVRDTFFFLYVNVVLLELLALVFRSFGLLICSVFIWFLRKASTKEPTEKNIEKKNTDNCDRLATCTYTTSCLMVILRYCDRVQRQYWVWEKIPLRITVIIASHFIDVFGILCLWSFITFGRTNWTMMTTSRSK